MASNEAFYGLVDFVGYPIALGPGRVGGRGWRGAGRPRAHTSMARYLALLEQEDAYRRGRRAEVETLQQRLTARRLEQEAADLFVRKQAEAAAYTIFFAEL